MPTLSQFFNQFTVDQIKNLSGLLPEIPRVGRKEQLVEAALRHYQGAGLASLWKRLDEVEQLALAEALYSIGGVFNAARFRAKYRKTAVFNVSPDRYGNTPTLLSVFLFTDEGVRTVPLDLLEPLKAFVAPPEPASLISTENLPEADEESPSTLRVMENEAMADLPLVLRLVGQGKIKVSDKTRQPGVATTQLLAGQLNNGDFYGYRPKKNDWDQEIGAIKAYAWPLLLQSGGLVQLEGTKLALSKSGLRALSASPAKVLRDLWNKWLKNSLLDEFSRVDVIKGQKGKGRVMAAVAPRRYAIEDALRHCPVGAWVQVDDFGRFMRAEDLDFTVCNDPWRLYVADPHYGALGYQGFHDWEILELRYLLALLFEYAAPLGLIDVAYVEPQGARRDFGQLWGTDDLEFLSRYDGLTHFRLTELGAYCLGLRDDYSPSRPASSARLSVLPSLRVQVVGGQPGAEEALLLDTWATRETDTTWLLDHHRALTAAEQGHDLEALRAFLRAGDEQALPDSVESFIDTVARNAPALKTVASALLVECPDPETACRIAERLTKLCHPAGPRHLAVRVEQADAFRTALHGLGYGWKV